MSSPSIPRGIAIVTKVHPGLLARGESPYSVHRAWPTAGPRNLLAAARARRACAAEAVRNIGSIGAQWTRVFVDGESLHDFECDMITTLQDAREVLAWQRDPRRAEAEAAMAAEQARDDVMAEDETACAREWAEYEISVTADDRDVDEEW